MKKRCSKCEKIKNVNKFHKHKGRRDGSNNICKKCNNQKSKEWQLKFPERVQASQKRKREKPEHREYMKEYYKKNSTCVTCKQCNKDFLAWNVAIKKGERKYCSQKCYNLSMKTKVSIICDRCNKSFEKHLCNIKKCNKNYCSTKCCGIAARKTNKPLLEQIRDVTRSKTWRLSVFERDNFLCQMPDCDKIERVLNAHHIKQKITIIQENNIKTLEQALQCKELWDINNGICLCQKCHRSIRGKEQKFENLFNKIINLK